MLPNGTALLFWVFFIHVAGIYLFTSGFLLTRLALTETASCPNGSCTLPATHKRAIVLIIDALRFDFVSPNPPEPNSPYHHNVLTLPQKLTSAHPQNSFIFNSYADPPTTTLQRIKGITTGSLPTFVDMGNNFGASSIAEDSLLQQLSISGKRSAFMGDDTWMSVFPDSFEFNMSFPYDSFNVEDLHTVDEGVIRHLFPLLEDKEKPFDFLVGHFLGVDHVGHRVGPDHPSMKAKLEQMNDVLTRVTDLLEEDTLLVVLGDHGMDRSGDHGGDDVFETSSALWIYSKGPALSIASSSPPSGLLRYITYPGASVSHRSVQQIDLLPTLSLLLGLPIPFNNLGSVIPELFWRGTKGKELSQALKLNTAQIKNYLDAYRASTSGAELDGAWESLESAWIATQTAYSSPEVGLILSSNFNRIALSACRSMWAQFNPMLMAFGLALLGVGLIATWSLYTGLSKARYQWEDWLTSRLHRCLRGIAGGAVLGMLGFLAAEPYLEGIDALDCILFAAPLTSCILVIFHTPPRFSLSSFPLLLSLHTIAFLSNSFTFWEDRILLFLVVSSLAPFVLTGLTAPTNRLRWRILGFSALFATCVRLMAVSTVCREEQQPYCHVTFYASSSIPVPPTLILIFALPTAIAIPIIFDRYLKISKSNSGVAQLFLPRVLMPVLVGGAAHWLMEWADSASVFHDEWSAVLRIARTWVARLSFGWIIVIGGGGWRTMPLCLRFEGEKGKVNVIGFANSFGSGYLLFWSIFLALVYACMQLTGQVVLGLTCVALVSYLEVVDSARDVKDMDIVVASSKPSLLMDPNSKAESETSSVVTFAEVVPIALLGLLTFYATGHQSTISSIQWKSGFMLTPTVTYPLSPLTVALNSFGPLFLAGLAVPLIALWNREPHLAPGSSPSKDPKLDVKVQGESVLAALGIMIYYACLLFGTALSAAILRRHLMVWKVFAPRFMAGAIGVLVVDLAAIVGIGVGVRHVAAKVNQYLKGAFVRPAAW